jgi:hypothetical protein
MQITRFLVRTTGAFAAVALAIVFAASAFAASGFVGKWETTAAKDKTFTIWLSDDGTAKGDAGGKGLGGNWKEEGEAAVITWETGWITKLVKEGDTYKKTTLNKDGKPVGEPADAKKVE